MYRLRDFLQEMILKDSGQIVSDEIYCLPSDGEKTFQVNQMRDTLCCYTFTLVTQGWLTLVYNGQELTLVPGDLYNYAPGFEVTVLCASGDYRSICLLADEQATFSMPIVRSVIRAAYFPVIQLNEPVLHLQATDAQRLKSRMTMVMEYLEGENLFRAESLRTVYALFLLDLMNIMEHSLRHITISERAENLFISFMRLLPLHFENHHDVSFYADQLCITTTHLSRIVRQLTGRTVVDYINQMLLMEASWLLHTTDLSIAAISERLHFADQSSFGRFFTRLKGTSPKVYRMTTNNVHPPLRGVQTLPLKVVDGGRAGRL